MDYLSDSDFDSQKVCVQMRHLDFPTRRLAAILFLVMMLFRCGSVQATIVPWVGPDLGNWNTPANWQDGAVFGLPNAAADEAAAINNNTTAVLSATAGTNVAGLILGQTAGTTGGLRITNGGNLTSVAGVAESGALTVGGAGQGNLTILGGGSLSGTVITLGGGTGSSLLLGDASGLTTTFSTSGNATLNRTTQVTGRFVNFNVGGNLTLSAASTLVGQINHNSLFSPLKSTGTANVSGTFKVEFNGVTPAAGNTWNIVDAATINGSFATLDTSAAPALPLGQTYRMKRSTGGNGQLLQLTVAQVLTLQVDRGTGAVSIANTGTGAQTIDGYSVLSSFGALTGNWNSLTDQNASGWVEADPMNTDLSELHSQAGGLTLNGGQSRTLGTPYVPAYPAFGVDPDHLKFEYSTSDGEEYTGVVQYTGTKVNNNLIVSVNPATGQSQLKNDSPFTIQIDGYSLYSTSGSLQPAQGKWMSLQDRGVAGWQEALPLAPTSISELNSDGVLTLSPFSGYDLGELYKSVGGTQDLRFEFLMAGAALPLDGKVVYGPFGPVSAPGLPGDFNNNGTVDAADYTVWRNNLGAANESALNGNGNGLNGVDQADYTLWKSNFGNSFGSGSGAAISSGSNVPEPSTSLLLLSIAGLFSSRRWSRSTHREMILSIWKSTMRTATCLEGSLAMERVYVGGGSALQRGLAVLVLISCFAGLVQAQAIIFKDDFDGDAVPAPGATPVAGTNVGAPWGINSISPTTYESTANPFPAGSFYANLLDPGPTPASIRLQSTAGNDTSLEASLNGQVSTYSFEFVEPTRSGDVNAMMTGYYRQQANPDLNGAGRSYTATMHDGTLSPQGPVLGGAATTYALDTVNTLFMFANDSASAVENYAGSGRTLADTSADVWISLAGAAPVYAFSVDKQNAAAPNDTPIAGIGFRSFNADIEQFFVNNVLLLSGASFDRTTFAGPCSLGDVNCDGSIDLENDFETIRANFRRNVASRSLGDLTADGMVTLSDFVQWKKAFLGGGGSLDNVDISFVSVPEPTSLTIVGAALLGLIGCRRRNSRSVCR